MLESDIGLIEMAGKQAKILSDQAARDLLFFADTTRHPDRNRVIVLLSLKAALRVAETAKLTWEMVDDAEGEIGSTLEVRDNVAKKRYGRRIPVQEELRQVLVTLRPSSPGSGPIVRSSWSMTPLSIVVWFNRAFQATGLSGCSSHSGRHSRKADRVR